ncbi:MAG: hypothetical protein AAB407_03610 [Patescibacteria group bacterium]
MSPEEKERAIDLFKAISGLSLTTEPVIANWIDAVVGQPEKIEKYVNFRLEQKVVVVPRQGPGGVISIRISDEPRENDTTATLLREAIQQAA